MSGPKHTPLDQLVEDALDEYSSGAYEKFSDARRALESITREAYELGRRDAAPRLAEALERVKEWNAEMHRANDPSLVPCFTSDLYNDWRELMIEVRAALREAGVE